MRRKKGRMPFADVSDLERVAVHVGEVFVSRKPAVAHTLLGSCVSVCLVDRAAGIGGMNHILLPGKADLHSFDAAARYGVNAMEMLIGGIQRAGAARKRLEAKVFGGANVLSGLERMFNPGFRNGAFVKEFLELEKIPVIGQDLGGFNARRIYLRTDTGEVFMKRIPRYQASNIVIEEREYSRRVEKELSQKGGVTLFKK